MCQVENEDVVGAAPTGDAPTTSDWSTLPTKVRLIFEVLRYIMWIDSKRFVSFNYETVSILISSIQTHESNLTLSFQPTLNTKQNLKLM